MSFSLILSDGEVYSPIFLLHLGFCAILTCPFPIWSISDNVDMSSLRGRCAKKTGKVSQNELSHPELKFNQKQVNQVNSSRVMIAGAQWKPSVDHNTRFIEMILFYGSIFHEQTKGQTNVRIGRNHNKTTATNLSPVYCKMEEYAGDLNGQERQTMV